MYVTDPSGRASDPPYHQEKQTVKPSKISKARYAEVQKQERKMLNGYQVENRPTTSSAPNCHVGEHIGLGLHHPDGHAAADDMSCSV